MNKLFKYFLSLSTIVLSVSCSGDDDNRSSNNTFQGEIEFTKSVGGTSDENIQSVIEVLDGYVYFGTTKSINGDITDKVQEENDFWLFKTDRDGNLLWSKTYGGSNDDQ